VAETLVAAPPLPMQRYTASVWIDEPHPLLRRGMVSCLTADDVPVAGESAVLAPGRALRDAAVLVFDGDRSDLAAFLDAMPRTSQTRPKLVAAVSEPDDERLERLARAGVSAILYRHELTPELLVATVRAVLQGRTSMPTDLLPRLLTKAARADRVERGALSERELAVLRMLADGEDTRGIAQGLCYSERTVKNVVHDVLTKLSCRTRAQAVATATRAGII
jgi:DNA-binding NarL/FixJ family response regulator